MLVLFLVSLSCFGEFHCVSVWPWSVQHVLLPQMNPLPCLLHNPPKPLQLPGILNSRTLLLLPALCSFQPYVSCHPLSSRTVTPRHMAFEGQRLSCHIKLSLLFKQAIRPVFSACFSLPHANPMGDPHGCCLWEAGSKARSAGLLYTGT